MSSRRCTEVAGTPNPKGPPSSPVQLRSAVWTGVTRDTGHTFPVDGSAAIAPAS
jgi:hypothetical protein